MKDSQREESLDESPPFFSTWNHWYVLVLLNLLFLIALFYWFTSYYNAKT